MSDREAPQPAESAQGATTLLERYATLEAAIGAWNGRRDKKIARINAVADGAVLPMVTELEQIRAQLEPWFRGEGQQLLSKGRKSLQLGGCNIGLKLGNTKLAHTFADDKKAVEALRGSSYARQTTILSYSLDKKATAKLLLVGSKKAKETLRELGFRIVPGQDTFFVNRVEQSGTVGG